MDPPPVQYVTTSDGYNIAYAISGEGRPFVFMPQPLSHVQLYWTEDTWARPWFQGLAARFRLVQYDGRGQGMSTRGLSADFSLQDMILDLEAVVDRLQLRSFVLMGVQPVAHTAIHYAIAHPERVEALVLASCPISVDSWPISMLLPLAERDWDALLRSLAGLSMASQVAASVARQKQTTTQADYLIRGRAALSSTVEHDAARLRTPTLVLHPRESMNLPPEESMKLAATIPNGRLVLIDGATPLGDPTAGLRAIDEFLRDLRRGQDGVVSSTTDIGPVSDSGLPGGLSAREAAVLRLIAAGRSNQQIADELVISLNTVRRHVSNIFDKTGAANRADAVSYAHRHGLV